MLFDWKNNKQDALENGIYEKKIYKSTDIIMKSTNKVVAHHMFRNFKKLKLEEGTLVEDCVFVDCGGVTFDECRIEGCTFARVDTIYATDSNFNNSNFKDLVCDNDLIISLANSEISHCVFENVELRNEAFLCDGDSDSLIEHCSFCNIRTDREDREIINCEEIVGKIFKRKQRWNIVYEDTCTGLDCSGALDE